MHRVETITVEGSPMEVFLFAPRGDGPHPAILLAQHIPGGHAGLENDPFTLETAERYAAHGYAVAVPFIFHWWPKGMDIDEKRNAWRDDRATADLRAAHDLLVGQGNVDGDRVGIVGHCWGGRVSWLGACHIATLKACAVFYGGRVKVAMGPNTPPPIELAGNIKCPVIGFFGNDDQNPSSADVDDYDAALTAAGVPHSFHRYDGAGHAFQMFNNPERYRKEASEDAWQKVLAFLGEALH
jgi:carboxymethylenebutenolidase